MMGLGYNELLLLLLLVFLLFGGRKLPEIARSLGRALREFRKVRNELTAELAETDPGHEQDADQTQETAAVDDDNPRS
jgi:TatA/E family protein of Tat protein translocase